LNVLNGLSLRSTIEHLNAPSNSSGSKSRFRRGLRWDTVFVTYAKS